jgi:hypothetical protein
VKGLDAPRRHAEPRSGAAVAVMFAEMQDQIAARDLAVDRGVGIEPMIPVQMESQILQIELVCLREVEGA